MRHLNNGTDHRHSKSCCDQSSPARRTITETVYFDMEDHVELYNETDGTWMWHIV